MFSLINFCDLLEKEYDLVRKDIMNAFCLTGAEVDILLFLENNPQYKSAQEIVEVRKIAKSHVSMTIKGLIEKGFLKKEKDPNNLRVYHLEILEEGKTVTVYGKKKQTKFFENLFSDFSEEEIEEFKRLYHRMIKNMMKEKIS
ncbi:MarR family winged helix-turn-helix transcriptional regulator [Gallicola sp. Sow4_E12]|uniref:MarR family winged helix-turn-helix transcriptional regulator n=1 Tax=Gallicola sp. Sow4_E12 TaxID=3438785 RepID=UPI003F939F9F